MLLLSRLRLITFDVTGTLLQFRRTIPEQYGHVGAFYGIQVDRGKLTANFKKHWERMTDEHPNFGLKTGLGWENWWRTLVKDPYEITGDPEDVGCSGVAPDRSLQNSVVLAAFPRCPGPVVFVITSYEAEIEKPDSRIFEEAKRLSRLKELCSDECLHVGDNPRLDYLGARDAGWQAALILPDKKRETTIAKHPGIDPSHINVCDIKVTSYVSHCNCFVQTAEVCYYLNLEF
ncbi:unnamed protein product [Callosobruchus maculatus]|uniref:Haloacid dehalogenase-like hydrolase domain-containing protein 3 n=1 Tax=Callosobruchus maculatus TaxID=64391 RepID=A0A653DUZ0_CALMS|nr:unnamed protein product [Callosobruchus maculatus]